MSSLNHSQPKAYWRSLSELAETPEFRANLQREFPDVPLTEAPSGLSRRRFVQLMGASLALASGTAGCRWPKENILPFTRRPDGHIGGVPQLYSTAMELGGYGAPLDAVSYDGRPIKVEGNPRHPFLNRGTDSFAQASVLELYDPDRSTGVMSCVGGQEFPRVWGEVVERLREAAARARAAGGKGLRILAPASQSPTVARLKGRLLAAYPQMAWIEYEPLADDNVRLGTQLAFGRSLRVHLQLEAARTVLVLDDDFLNEGPAALAYARDFAQVRRPELGSAMCRLYAAESRFTATGAMADHRLALRSEQLGPLLTLVAQQLVQRPGMAAPATLKAALATAAPAWAQQPSIVRFAGAVASDLAANAGHALVVVGSGQPPEVQALAQQLNALLGGINQTVSYTADGVGSGPACVDALAALAQEMHAGQVETLVILGGNPVYAAPVGLKFGEALDKVKTSVHLSLYRDETSRRAGWHLPAAHYLESWGDVRSFDGTISLVQPLIAPLYQGRTAIEVMALLLGQDGAKPRELVRETFAQLPGGTTEASWRQALSEGFVAGTAWAPVTPTPAPLRPMSVPASAGVDSPGNGALELTLWSDPHTYDGRFANNGWLQELPDFMSKLTWDNVAYLAPQTASALQIAHGSMLRLEHGGQSLEMAAYIMPGQAAGSVAVTLGHGRREAGRIGGSQLQAVAATGFDTYRLHPGLGRNHLSGLTLVPTGATYALAITQEHHMLEPLAKRGVERRVVEIVREATVAEYAESPHFAQEVVEHPPLKSLWTERDQTTGHRWGMTIDLNACTGCNACVVACQAENNIPIVGKEQVIRGREMHWLRIDRYFSGAPEAPKVTAQAMLCQQCENAPCEQVCPVAATVHSHEGLNDMVYNRCIGTRYCSNNCPYKVRRFNFFNYHKNLTEPREQVAKMVYNPEVTVRARGVMEKCNYCVQRIQNTKINAHNAKRPIADGEITTACAQACASGAITFGDLNLEGSEVAKKQADSRAYAVLGELNTKPRTQYLAKVTNPNSELAEGS